MFFVTCNGKLTSAVTEKENSSANDDNALTAGGCVSDSSSISAGYYAAETAGTQKPYNYESIVSPFRERKNVTSPEYFAITERKTNVH